MTAPTRADVDNVVRDLAREMFCAVADESWWNVGPAVHDIYIRLAEVAYEWRFGEPRYDEEEDDE